MCKCAPAVKTPYCGNAETGCVWPGDSGWQSSTQPVHLVQDPAKTQEQRAVEALESIASSLHQIARRLGW